MKHMDLLRATAVVLLAVVALRAWAPASADLEGFELADPLAWLGRTGQYALVTGPMICTAGEEWELDVTLVQDSSGVQAGGRGRGMCMGDAQRWSVSADVAAGLSVLVPGPARFCAAARTLSGGSLTDTHQWCGELMLQEAQMVDPTARLNGTGSYALVTGPLACDSGEDFTVTLIVTQVGGAEATAMTQGMCTGDVQRWRATAMVPAAGPAFVGGPAQVCASALSRTGETVANMQQWCREVTLLQAAPPLYQRLVSALNHGDLEGALTFVTDDAFLLGTFVCPPPDGCAGKAAIRTDFEAEIADRVHFTPTSARVSGDTITVRFEYRANSIRAAGVERIIILGTVERRGDQFSRAVLEPDAADGQTAAFLATLAGPVPAPALAPTPRALPATSDGRCEDGGGCE